MELVKGLEHKSDEECLWELRALSLETRSLGKDFTALDSYLKGGCSQVGISVFSLLNE